MKKIKAVENLLWLGRVGEGMRQFEGLKSPQAMKFKNYLEKHQGKILNYQECQRVGMTIGSASVESKIKQIGARVKIQWGKLETAKCCPNPQTSLCLFKQFTLSKYFCLTSDWDAPYRLDYSGKVQE